MSHGLISPVWSVGYCRLNCTKRVEIRPPFSDVYGTAVLQELAADGSNLAAVCEGRVELNYISGEKCFIAEGLGVMLWNRYARWQTRALDRFFGGKATYLEQLRCADVAGQRVLHLGCGRDLNGVTGLLSDGDLVIGVDVDREALQQYPAASWYLAANELPFADASFDLVISEFVLEHLEHPDQVFREIFRVLSPGGRFISVAPNVWSYKSIGAKLIPNRLHAWFVCILRPESRRESRDVYPTYFRANSARSLRRLARNGDVELVRLEYCNNGPTWFRRIPGLFELGLLVHKAMDVSALAGLRCNLIVEFRKLGSGPRSSELCVCIHCGGALAGEFGRTDLKCRDCDKVFVLSGRMYA